MKLLTNELQKSYEKAKIYYNCGEKNEYKNAYDIKYCKPGVHNICNLEYSTPN